MYVAPVEIYSDQTNAAVMRHPDRKFPGILIQGDSLSILCGDADELCRQARSKVDDELYSDLNDLRNALQRYLAAYKAALAAHDLRLPFSDRAPQT